jgi:uncharacterized repeat protein (TIGR03806 family)
MKKIHSLLLLLLCFEIISCSKSDDYTPAPSPVVMDLTQVPYPKLSDYKFFEGEIRNQNPSIGVLPYKPTSELFTDYAKKSRFIWLPANTKATYSSNHDVIQLPIGGALIKTFYYDNVQPSNNRKIIETRVMINTQSGWIFAEYVWNEDQTEAFLDMLGSTVPITILQNNTALSIDYMIPDESKCIACHAVEDVNTPIGIKPQNLNSNYTYTNGNMNQLSKWVATGLLEDNLPASIQSVVDYQDTSKSLNLRARSYFDIQCAHCHQEGGSAGYVDMRFAFSETVDPLKMGVCVNPGLQVPGIGHSGKIVKPIDAANSTLFYMISTNESNYKMPRIGRTIVHQEGVQLVEQWINSLTPCP